MWRRDSATPCGLCPAPWNSCWGSASASSCEQGGRAPGEAPRIPARRPAGEPSGSRSPSPRQATPATNAGAQAREGNEGGLQPLHLGWPATLRWGYGLKCTGRTPGDELALGLAAPDTRAWRCPRLLPPAAWEATLCAPCPSVGSPTEKASQPPVGCRWRRGCRSRVAVCANKPPVPTHR